VNPDRRPTFPELADWVDGRLDAATASGVERALGDPATAATLRWLHGFRRLARELPVEAPPAIIRQNLRRAFARRVDPQPTVGIIELAARLVFDSRRHLEPAGVRAVTDAGRSVHLAFAAPGIDLVVDVHRRPDGDLLDLDVQVYLDEDRPQAPVFEAVARGSGWITRTSECDVLGRFRLQRIGPEEVGLRVTNGEIALTASLDLRHIGP
jgi:hypothetical protein